MDEEQQMTRLLNRAADSAGHFAPVSAEELIARPASRGISLQPLLAVAATVVVTAGLAFGLSVVGRGSPSPTPQPVAATGPGSAAQLAHDHWASLPPMPIPTATTEIAQWTGHVLLVVGDNGTSASYDPATRGWTMLATGPRLAGSTISAWDGSSLYVWATNRNKQGFEDAGGRFDVADNTWHTVPAPPIDTAGGASAVAVDHHLLVFGVGHGVTSTVHVATIGDTGKWSALPGLHGPSESVVSATALNAGSRALVAVGIGKAQGNSSMPSSTGQQLYSFSPADRRWTKVPVSPIDAYPTSDLLWTGSRLVVPNSSSNDDGAEIADVIDTDTGRRTQSPPWVVPGSSVTNNPDGSQSGGSPGVDYVWTGHALIGLVQADGVSVSQHVGAGMWQPGTDHWQGLPSVDRPGGTPVWAGDRLIVPCQAAAGCRGVQLAP